jgi:hypothetical protein
MEVETTKVLLEVLKSSPTFGVFALALLWFARRDLTKYVSGVGKYADDYLQLQREMVGVGRDSAIATKELASSIASSMDRFEATATSSLESLSSELQSFRREMDPILRASPTTRVAGDILLVSTTASARVRSTVAECVENGRLIVATSIDDALGALGAYSIRAVIVDDTVSATSVDAIASIGAPVVFLSVDGRGVDVEVLRLVNSSIQVDELSSASLRRAIGLKNVQVVEFNSSRRPNGRL